MKLTIAKQLSALIPLILSGCGGAISQATSEKVIFISSSGMLDPDKTYDKGTFLFKRGDASFEVKIAGGKGGGVIQPLIKQDFSISGEGGRRDELLYENSSFSVALWPNQQLRLAWAPKMGFVAYVHTLSEGIVYAEPRFYVSSSGLIAVLWKEDVGSFTVWIIDPEFVAGGPIGDPIL